MPLSVGANIVTGPEDPTVGDLAQWSEDIGTIDATWTDPDGQVWQLSNTDDELGYFTTDQIAGWGATPIELVTDPLSRGGEEVRFVRAQPRRITWPLHIHGDTHLQFLTRYRNLMRAFTMTTHRRAPGILRVARPDGEDNVREIECWYEDGFRGEPGQNWVYANPVLTLMAPDGYWRATQPLVFRYDYAPGRPFLRPYPSLSTSRVLGDMTIDNPGEVDAWPVLQLTGPASAFTATNPGAGGGFTLTYPLAAGQTVTIATNRPVVRGPAGENLAGALSWPRAVLWPLRSGANPVTLTVAGAGIGTALTVSFRPRFEGA
ncbi:hypothetical protein [Actinoplanes sp. NPDC026623]|uniref:hypothetical protein n=1 Tax=Actinoplanes sp. NPDC026623 TaxID=3155610 RepID=UPI003404754A